MLPFTMRKITFKYSIFYDTFLVERRYINEIVNFAHVDRNLQTKYIRVK